MDNKYCKTTSYQTDKNDLIITHGPNLTPELIKLLGLQLTISGNALGGHLPFLFFLSFIFFSGVIKAQSLVYTTCVHVCDREKKSDYNTNR